MTTPFESLASARAARLARLPIVAMLTLSTLMMSALPADAAKPQKTPQPVSIVPLTVQNVIVQNGQLFAIVSLGGVTQLVPATLALDPNQPAGTTCPILDLHLGAIHLSLLGLNVDTSEICLKITAEQGGGLLGDLLCSVANLLQGGTPLSDILGGLTAVNPADLLSGLTSLLNNVVGQIGTFNPAIQTVHNLSATCNILNLTLGPIDLTLLGLNVHLDNCAGGPVVVSITATQGGGLLGDLLCDLSDLLSNRASFTAILSTLQEIAAAIQALL